MKESAIKFRLFVSKIIRNEPFDPQDEDTSMDNVEDTRVKQTNIVDNIDVATGIDLTAKVADQNEESHKSLSVKPIRTPTKSFKKAPTETKNIKSTMDKVLAKDIKDNDIPVTKDVDKDKLKDQEAKLEKISKKIVSATNNSLGTTNDAIDDLANDQDFKDMLTDINDISADDSAVDISPTRAARLNDLNSKFLDSTINGQVVKDILNGFSQIDEAKIATSNLKVSRPNK